ALRRESLREQRVFVVEHEREALLRDITWRLSVNGVAEVHVVRGDRLRHRARRAARLEENPRHFLARADLGERSILRLVEIDRERLAVGREQLLLVAGSIHGKQTVNGTESVAEQKRITPNRAGRRSFQRIKAFL